MTCFSHSHNNNEFGPSFSDACTMSPETMWIILSQHPIFCYVYRSLIWHRSQMAEQYYRHRMRAVALLRWLKFMGRAASGGGAGPLD